MTRLDPMIAVRNVRSSSLWYNRIFEFENAHGGDHFAVLTYEGEIVLCLHAWEEDDHPTMKNPSKGVGNGLLLYFWTDPIETVYQKAKNAGIIPEQEMRRQDA